MVCSAIRIYTTFSARDFSVTSESWQGDSVAVNHQTPLLLWLYNFWINRQKLMKFVHVDSTFGYAATRSRAIKFHIKPLRWPTATGSKSTQSPKWTTLAIKINTNAGRGCKLLIKPTNDLEKSWKVLISKCPPFTLTHAACSSMCCLTVSMCWSSHVTSHLHTHYTVEVV